MEPWLGLFALAILPLPASANGGHLVSWDGAKKDRRWLEAFEYLKDYHDQDCQDYHDQDYEDYQDQATSHGDPSVIDKSWPIKSTK